MLKELMYTSCAVKGFTEADLTNVLQVSEVYNAERFITGVLLYDGTAFMQILEGEEADVQELFERIKRDPRHSNVKLESFVAIKKRTFPNWSLKSIKVSIAISNPCPNPDT